MTFGFRYPVIRPPAGPYSRPYVPPLPFPGGRPAGGSGAGGGGGPLPFPYLPPAPIAGPTLADIGRAIGEAAARVGEGIAAVAAQIWAYLNPFKTPGAVIPGHTISGPISVPAGGYVRVLVRGGEWSYSPPPGQTGGAYIFIDGINTSLYGPLTGISITAPALQGRGDQIGPQFTVFRITATGTGPGAGVREIGIQEYALAVPEGNWVWAEYPQLTELVIVGAGAADGPVVWPSQAPPIRFDNLPAIDWPAPGLPDVAPAPAPGPGPRRRTQPQVAPLPGSPARPAPATTPEPLPSPTTPDQPWTPAPTPAPDTTPAPSPAPGPGPAPRPGPGPVPVPVPVPRPATAPTPGPLPNTTPTRPDGTPAPVQPAPVPTTPRDRITVGNPTAPITIDPAPVPANLPGIALELGRIERKLEVVLGDPRGGLPQWLQNLADLAPLLGLLGELLTAADPGGAYELSSPCEVDEEGNPLPPVVVPVPGTIGANAAVLARVDALAELMQVHKNLRQPSCKNPRPLGDAVTVQFIET